SGHGADGESKSAKHRRRGGARSRARPEARRHRLVGSAWRRKAQEGQEAARQTLFDWRVRSTASLTPLLETQRLQPSSWPALGPAVRHWKRLVSSRLFA